MGDHEASAQAIPSEQLTGLAGDQNRFPLPGSHRGHRPRRRRAKRPRGSASTCARGSCHRSRDYGRMGEVFAAGSLFLAMSAYLPTSNRTCDPDWETTALPTDPAQRHKSSPAGATLIGWLLPPSWSSTTTRRFGGCSPGREPSRRAPNGRWGVPTSATGRLREHAHGSSARSCRLANRREQG